MPDKRREDEQLPPIPDGGLAQSMPDWLRRPPAWRTLHDTEIEQPKPATTGELPEADTSVIDPRTFLTDDDLPAWLRRFGALSRPVSSKAEAREDDDAVASNDEPDGERAVAPVATVPGPVASSRFVPRSPVVTQTDRREASRRPTTSAAPSRTTRASGYRAAWWQGPQLAILLAVALLVALVIIAILVT